jgi:acetoin utilization protein AcuB
MEIWKGERRPTIKSVMTAFPHSVDIDAPVARAQEIMRRYDTLHVPVEEKGSLVGVATHFDIERRAGAAEDGEAGLRVRDVYVSDPYVVDLNAPLDRVLYEMAERQVDATLVVRKGKLVGVFTVMDACRLLAQVVRSRFAPSGGTDAA